MALQYQCVDHYYCHGHYSSCGHRGFYFVASGTCSSIENKIPLEWRIRTGINSGGGGGLGSWSRASGLAGAFSWRVHRPSGRGILPNGRGHFLSWQCCQEALDCCLGWRAREVFTVTRCDDQVDLVWRYGGGLLFFSSRNGLWRSLVAHLTGGQGVAGSNPVSPTKRNPLRLAVSQAEAGFSIPASD